MKLYKSKAKYKSSDDDQYYNPITLWFPMPLDQYYFGFNGLSYKKGQEENFDISLEYWCKDNSPYHLLYKGTKHK